MIELYQHNQQPRLDTAGVTSRGTKPEAVSPDSKQQLDCKSGGQTDQHPSNGKKDKT